MGLSEEPPFSEGELAGEDPGDFPLEGDFEGVGALPDVVGDGDFACDCEGVGALLDDVVGDFAGAVVFVSGAGLLLVSGAGLFLFVGAGDFVVDGVGEELCCWPFEREDNKRNANGIRRERGAENRWRDIVEKKKNQ